MRVEPHHTPERLADLIRRETCARAARRMAAVRLALLGRTPEQVGPQVLLSPRQVRTWLGRYSAAGLAGLADRQGRGRKGPLTPEQAAALKARVKAGPTKADGVCALRGEDVRRILKEEFGVLRGLQAVYDLLRRLGLSLLRPRPRHPKGDPDEQEAFKKSSPATWRRWRRPTPASGWRRGSRTRPGSGSRGR